jgi:2-dehydropantoate 2-reductase
MTRNRPTNNGRTFAVIGAGAIGGYYGGLLARSGREVHFLLRGDYDHVRDHGLIIESVGGGFELPHVNAHRSTATMPRCDVVIVALKSVHNGILPAVLPSLLHDDSTVIIMQNGLGAEEGVAAIAGVRRVMGALCFVCSTKTGPGHIRHLDYGHVTLGEYTPATGGAGITQRLREIANDFEEVGVTMILAENLAAARWRKLVWNIPNNGLSVILDATTREVVRSDSGRSLAIGLMKEVLEGASACGYRIEQEIIPEMLKVTENMIPYHPSMKLDFDNKRPMEVEAIYGAPLRAARKAGLDLPHISMLYNQLLFLDMRNRSV